MVDIMIECRGGMPPLFAQEARNSFEYMPIALATHKGTLLASGGLFIMGFTQFSLPFQGFMV